MNGYSIAGYSLGDAIGIIATAERLRRVKAANGGREKRRRPTTIKLSQHRAGGRARR